MLVLRDLLRDLDVQVHAGEAALDAGVRWVHSSELSDPTPFLSGGELMLTTGLALTRPVEQRAYIERLHAHGLTGVGFGTGFTHATMPAALVETAAELGFPLFEVPYEMPFIAITERAAARIVNEHYAVLQRALSAHEKLERVVLSERGLDGVTGALAGQIGGAALVYDGRAELLAAARERKLDLDAIAAELRDRTRSGARRGFAPGGEIEGRALAVPISRAPGDDAALPQAWLVAVKETGALTEFDRLVVHQAVTIVALELLRRRVADETVRRLAGDVLSAVLSGELAGPELARRLEPFGLRGRVGTLVLQPPRQIRAAAAQELERALRDEAGGGLVAEAGAFMVALLPGADDDELFAAAERVRARVQTQVAQPLPAAAGRAGDVRSSFHEARCAFEARALAEPQSHASGNGSGARDGDANAEAPARLATYRDLGSFQLLLSLQDDEALKLFCDSVLAPIERSEGAYGGELMRSLEAFIENNGQWERAARQLYCHRHTLRYRIRRVEELTGRSLDSARDRIDFWLALRGRELIR